MCQAQRLCMILCICNVQNRQMHRDRKCISDCQGPVSGDMRVIDIWDMGYGLLFSGWWNILKLFCDDGSTTLNIQKKKKKPLKGTL